MVGLCRLKEIDFDSGNEFVFLPRVCIRKKRAVWGIELVTFSIEIQKIE